MSSSSPERASPRDEVNSYGNNQTVNPHPTGINNDGDGISSKRNCWNSTARERNRLRSRFILRNKIAALSVSSSTSSPSSSYNNDKNNINDVKQKIMKKSSLSKDIINNSDDDNTANNNHQQWITDILHAIEYNQSSQLGITKLVSSNNSNTNNDDDDTIHHIDDSHPIHLLDMNRLRTICTSRFGAEFAAKAVCYVMKRRFSKGVIGNDNDCDNSNSNSSHVNDEGDGGGIVGLTFCEYAALMGQYRALGCLLIATANPVSQREDSITNTDDDLMITVGMKVVSYFCGGGGGICCPLTLYCGIVRSVVEMRVDGWAADITTAAANNDDGCCPICSRHYDWLLNWGSPCQHQFCERCIWDDILSHANERDEILCPICKKPRDYPMTTTSRNNNNETTPTTNIITAEQRRINSLSKYTLLPSTSKILKRQPTKKKKHLNKNPIHHTWSTATQYKIGNSRDIRLEKFFTFIKKNAIHHLKSCLTHGIDVNARNDYGQTGLYIACWYGWRAIVECLLGEYDANLTIMPYGDGSSDVWSVAEVNGHFGVLEVLERFCAVEQVMMWKERRRRRWQHKESLTCGNGGLSSRLTMLIPMDGKDGSRCHDGCRHPGAGSFYIDDAISDSEMMEQLDNLWKTIPIATGSNGDDAALSSSSLRSYYCDAEGIISHAMIQSIHSCFHTTLKKKTVTVETFPDMRFLHYIHPGSKCSPHVDLYRTDDDRRNINRSSHDQQQQQPPRRSTHTFILYLKDCAQGGETVLLNPRKDDDDHNYEARAVVTPKRGRLLIFPHLCPHEGRVVVSVPKVLLRGEIYLSVEDDVA